MLEGQSITLVFIFVAIGWGIQLAFAYRQMKRFYARLRILRKSGLTAVGMGGTRYTGRVYGVLTVDKDTRIIMHAEKLAGLTVFSDLKPIPGMIGKPFEDMLSGKLTENLPKKIKAALANAAKDIERALNAPPPDVEETSTQPDSSSVLNPDTVTG